MRKTSRGRVTQRKRPARLVMPKPKRVPCLRPHWVSTPTPKKEKTQFAVKHLVPKVCKLAQKQTNRLRRLPTPLGKSSCLVRNVYLTWRTKTWPWPVRHWRLSNMRLLPWLLQRQLYLQWPKLRQRLHQLSWKLCRHMWRPVSYRKPQLNQLLN